MTETEWQTAVTAFTTAKNFSLKLYVDDTVVGNIKSDGDKYYDADGEERIFAKVEDEYFRYNKANAQADWTKDEITEDEYNDAIDNSARSLALAAAVAFGNNYSSFTFADGVYTAQTLNVSSGFTLKNIDVTCNGAAITQIACTREDTDYDTVIMITSIGSTAIPLPVITSIPAASITLNKESLMLQEGQHRTLIATVAPDNTTDKTVVWTSSDPDVATVDDEGKVTAEQEGTTTITAKTANNITATCEVTVIVPTPGLTYGTSSDKMSATVTGMGTAQGTDIVIAAEYNALPVTTINSSVFWNKPITSITMPDTVTTISNAAFMDCTSLTEINFPDSLTYIGGAAFQGCTAIEEITLPNGVTYVGSGAFQGCSSLEEINIPDSVTTLGATAFDGTAWYNAQPDGLLYIGNFVCKYKGTMPADASLDIKDGTKIIALGAFHNCSTLKEINIPSGVEIICEQAFMSCSGLTEITLPVSVKSIGTNSFFYTPIQTATVPAMAVPYIKNSALQTVEVTGGELIDPSALTGCFSLISVTISGDVNTIGGSAFYNCGNLSSVTISGDVDTIGNGAFNNCPSLTAVTITGNVRYIDALAFTNCPIANITLPDGLEYIGASAFSGCSPLEQINIPDSVKYIGAYAFNGTAWYNAQNDGLIYLSDFLYKYKGTMPADTSITVENGTKGILGHAFEGCTGLVSITVPDTVKYIGETVFYNCTSLENVTLAEGVAKIEGSAFYGCTALTSITLPNTVTSLGGSVFYGCSNLEQITLSENIDAIGESAFHSCTSLTSISIPGSVKSIAQVAFTGCSNLESVTMGEGLVTIGFNAFSNCTNLAEISIPDSVEKIGYGAFDTTAWYNAQDDGLVYAGKVAYKYKGTMPANTSITLKEGTTGVAGRAFYNCTNLTEIIIPDTVTNIGADGLRNTRITSITLPDSVQELNTDAFNSCSRLTSIVIPEGVTIIGYQVFRDCSNLTSVTIPNTVIEIGKWSFQDCSSLTDINYEGTRAQWAAIKKATNNNDKWDSYTGNYTIHCTDGDISK